MDAAKEMNLRLKNLAMPIGAFALQLDVELTQQVTAVFGPSGAGKTSLLDLIAGLRRARSAFIELNGCVLTNTERGIEVPTRSRRIGYVPQDLALFPHLTVRQNLLYGVTKVASSSIFGFAHVVDVLEIGGLVDRSILHLSGGEKQLLTSPQLLLLDEPLGSLDAKLKAKLIPYFRRIRDEFHMPMLYITHDPDEVAALCDEVLVLRDGRCLRRGAPDVVFRREQQVRYVSIDDPEPTA
jgi:molybdate transport system ATP-binding protein